LFSAFVDEVREVWVVLKGLCAYAVCLGGFCLLECVQKSLTEPKISHCLAQLRNSGRSRRHDIAKAVAVRPPWVSIGA